MIELVWPWLLAAVLLPLLVRLTFPAAESARGAIRIPFYARVARDSEPGRTPWYRMLLAALAWLALVLAAARPQWVDEPLALPATGRDLLLSVDISGSMETADLFLGSQPATRLDVVKNVLGEFLDRRQGDRVGLILFGRRAYLQTPLTFDRNTTRQMLDESVIGLAGKETAIGDAIGLAVKRLREQEHDQKVLILLTDGANTAGAVDPLKAAQLAAQEGVKIYTIGVGADEMMVRSLFGTRRVNPSADLDEDTLRTIADQTGGRYFRARDTDELVEIYAALDELEPVESDAEVVRPRRELFYWPLGVALSIAALLLLGRLVGLPPGEDRRMIEQLSQLHFLRPAWLLALLAAPVIAWILWRRMNIQSRWAAFCDTELLEYLGFDPGKGARRGWIVVVVLWWIIATVAAAGPAFRMQPQALFKSVEARVVLMDLSQSMLAADLKPNRLDQARFKLIDLLGRVEEGQTALIAYAGEPFIVSPLTDDANTIRNMVGALDPGIMPAAGSEADEALALAAELLSRVGDGRGDVLVLSDDVNAAAIEVAADLSARGIRVSVLGVGTPEGAPITLANGSVLKTDAGRIVIPQLNEERLAALARAGGGQYVRITSGPEDLDLLLSAATGVGSGGVEATDRESARWQDDGPWLVLLLLPLAALAFRRGVLLVVPLAVVGLTASPGAQAAAWDSWFATPEQRAARAMQAEDYDTAANLAEDPLRRGNAHYRNGEFEAAASAFARAEGAEGAYNLGNALAQQQRYEEALAAYDRALADVPDMEDAVFNRDLVEKLLEEQQQQEQDQQSDSEEQENQDQQQQEGEDQEAEGDSQQEQESEGEPEPSEEEGDPKAEPVEEDLSEEEQQALEQWLRRIPDDPGGLLRRKFLLEYQRRGSPQPREGEDW